MTVVAFGVWAHRTFVTDRRTDGRTDRQTDGFAVAIDDTLQSNVRQKRKTGLTETNVHTLEVLTSVLSN